MFESSVKVAARLFLALGLFWGAVDSGAHAQDPQALPGGAPLSEPADDETEGLEPPPGDPWSAAPQQVRSQRATAGDGLVFKGRITPHWYDHSNRFWYRNDLVKGAREFVTVDAEKGDRKPAFDHQKLADALSKAGPTQNLDAGRLPFDSIEFTPDSKALLFRVGDVDWKCDLEKYECTRAKPGDLAKGATPSQPAAAQNSIGRPLSGRGDDAADRPGGSRKSPDGKWTALVKDHNVFVRPEGKPDEIRLSDDGTEKLSYGRLSWAPDSKTLVAFRIEPGDRKEVYLVQSSPSGGGRAKLQSRPYPLPGDKFTAYELNLFDVDAKKARKPKIDRVDFGTPRLRWSKDGRHFTYQKTDRGHQRFRLIEVDAHTGEARDIIDEKSATFIWTAHREAFNLETVTWLDDSDEIIYVSERDGWRHLYLIDAKTGQVKNDMTPGAYVVRGVDQVDQAKREIWFRASGKNPDQDPYFLHYYRVGFDGKGLVALTEGDGSHTVQYSPDRRFLIDTFSRVDAPPAHELRRVSDGRLVCKLEQADASALLAGGWKPPEVFVAKGRDGKTDIWGIVCRPKGYNPGRKYPVIEQIYAGPQGSFVPKTFSAAGRFSFLTDLGFIVVQMDGMGTANRSKAFHDVCWHNLKDAGFPDRILWHQALAKRDPSYDLSRVGIYGTSAGGQNAAGGVLFHPDFYKVAVAACGCHDNRMDKASWNEQWMGYPVGPWYAASSNVDNAQRLVGKLLLIVGEMDSNVPPESTMRVVDALIKAGKDFDLLVVPGANHGMGGAYGQRRLRDFFVRHLQGGGPSEPASPPTHNDVIARAGANGHAAPSPTANQHDSSSTGLDLVDLSGDKSELRGAIERYVTDRGSFQRSLPPAASPERDERVRSFTKHWLDGLGSLEFDRLSQDGKVDYLLLKNHLAHELRRLDIRGREQVAAASLVTFGQPILDLDRARRELKPMDWPKVAGTLTGLTKTISEARQALEREPRSKAPMKKPVANRALADVESLRGTLRGWYGFYDGYDPLFTWWMAEPYKVADAAIEAYAGVVRQKLGAVDSSFADGPGPGPGRRRGGGGAGGGGAGGGGGGREEPSAPSGRPEPAARDREIVGSPIGREALLSELQYEMIAYTPEELIELARTELAWCEDQMKKAAKEMGKGDDWKAALEHVKTLHVEPGKQPALIRDLAVEAIEYMDAHDLVTVPELCRESWRMAMMSPERQLVNPFFTGGEVISVSFPTASMPHEAKLMSLRGNNIHFSRATVFHEVIPGHHLQQYMLSRYKTYRGAFGTPFWMEGWALYWELLLWDKEFAKSPENRVGMLFWRMHRCARIIFSLGFHLEKMTPKECIDFLVDKIGHERDNATAEVRRSFTTSYGPLYQAAYLLGGLQLRSLHRELVESGKMTDRQFHDAILKENAIPIEMVRALVGERKLTPDFKPDWKFYAPTPSKN
jgi:dipeptidyl aminopeptidase/acylaminoacyl peptidase